MTERAAIEPTPARRSRVWIALVAQPLVLAAVFMAFGAYFVAARGLQGDEVAKAIEAISALPVSIGFAAAFLLTRRLAGKDGLSLRELGWTRPSAADVAIGLAAAALLHAANSFALHPLVQAAQPKFDPTVPHLGLPAVIAMLTIAVVAEDTLYRGYAFRVLRERHGTAAAVAVTSVFYALIAPQGLALMVWAVYFGVVLSCLRLWRKNLWPVAMVHLLVGLAPKLLAQL